ncbi:unnamed protein product [Gadus morhua 'NCC']
MEEDVVEAGDEAEGVAGEKAGDRPEEVAGDRPEDVAEARSISASERLSICLRYLATGDSYRTIANSFRVGISTVSSIVPDVATAIWDSLVEEFMAVPSQHILTPSA